MAAILTWGYYSSLHSAVNENAFVKAEARAEAEVRAAIGALRWEMIVSDIEAGIFTEDDFRYKPLLDCICMTINYMAVIGTRVGQGITSISNDGYSESYSGDLQKASDATEELRKNIRLWLSGTGLVGAY